MKGMSIRAALATVLIAASIRWSGAYPDCAQHPSYTGGSKYNYNGNDNVEEEEVDEDVYYSNGTGQYYQEQYVQQQWYPNNGVPMPRACTDPASNPRGYYNANLAPCRLQFHKISNDGDDSPYELSTACSDENLVGGSASDAAAGQKGSALYEYVSNWPDECVGSFKRCYSIAKDERVFINEACRHGLVFPEGTTHVSLDCTDDRTMKQDATEKQNPTDLWTDGVLVSDDQIFRAQQKQINDEIHEMEKVLFIIVAVVLVSCLGCLCAAYLLVVKPYQDTIKETRRTERDGLIMNNTDDDDTTTASNGLSEVRLA